MRQLFYNNVGSSNSRRMAEFEEEFDLGNDEGAEDDEEIRGFNAHHKQDKDRFRMETMESPDKLPGG